MSSFEVDYEEDLVPRIRDLIDGYGKDSILKEYTLNAYNSCIAKNKDIYYDF